MKAELLETINDFGKTEQSYYLQQPTTPNYVVVTIRSNSDPGVEQQLAEIEKSFKLL